MDYYTHGGSKKHRPIEPHGKRDVMDLKHQIHCMETEAYSSVLKAFITQSDLLTWVKEALMTDLRKELNISDKEHGEILTKINTDESVKWIREQRRVASHAQDKVASHAQDKVASQAQDYLKVNTPGCASASMGNSVIRLKAPPSAAFYPQKNVPHRQVSLPSFPVTYSKPPKFNEDRLSADISLGKVSTEMVSSNIKLPPNGRGKVLKGKHHMKKDFHTSECVQLKNKSDLIQIPATDRVIHNVEKMLFSGEKPGPVEIERAKWTLREQEKALIEALGKLNDEIERDDTADQMRHYEVPKNTPGGQEMMMHGNFCGPVGTLNGLGNSFRFMPSG